MFVAAQIEFLLDPSDGRVQIHAASMLFDLSQDFDFFQAEAKKLGSNRESLAYKRCARMAVLSFAAYFDGVVSRWAEAIDQGFRSGHHQIGPKLDLIRRELFGRRGL